MKVIIFKEGFPKKYINYYADLGRELVAHATLEEALCHCAEYELFDSYECTIEFGWDPVKKAHYAEAFDFSDEFERRRKQAREQAREECNYNYSVYRL